VFGPPFLVCKGRARAQGLTSERWRDIGRGTLPMSTTESVATLDGDESKKSRAAIRDGFCDHGIRRRA
jgi:hypothetical protein